MTKRYLLMEAKGDSKKVIRTSNDAEMTEEAAQTFNSYIKYYNYYVIDKLNPPKDYKELK